MGTGYLLDNNTIIDFSTNKLPQPSLVKIATIIDTVPQISIINKIELLSLAETPEVIKIFVEEADILKLDDEIVTKTIYLRTKYKIKLPDAIIAATALVFKLTLITHNTSDFKNIKGLKLADSYSLKAISV